MSSDKQTLAKPDAATTGAKGSGFKGMDSAAVKSHDEHEKAEHQHDKDKGRDKGHDMPPAVPQKGTHAKGEHPADKPMDNKVNTPMDKGVKTGV